MIKLEKCHRCAGIGWIEVQRNTPLLKGIFEEDCPECNGTGHAEYDLNEDVEDWMEDRS